MVSDTALIGLLKNPMIRQLLSQLVLSQGDRENSDNQQQQDPTQFISALQGQQNLQDQQQKVDPQEYRRKRLAMFQQLMG